MLPTENTSRTWLYVRYHYQVQRKIVLPLPFHSKSTVPLTLDAEQRPFMNPTDIPGLGLGESSLPACQNDTRLPDEQVENGMK